MNEYRIDIKVRNNLLLSKIEKIGFKSIPDFCKNHGISYRTVIKLISMKMKATDKNGNFLDTVYKISDALCCSPEDIFTEKQINAELKTNKKTLLVNEAEIQFCIESLSQNNLLLEDKVNIEQRDKILFEKLDSLYPREREIIMMRFGLGGEEEHTLEEIGKKFGVTRSRIREIEAKAIRKLRHPSRSDELEEFI